MIVSTNVALSSSGLARTLGRSAFARPQSTRRAFEPLRKHALPAIAARFASSDSAKQGKIHQVIGAVVDGMTTPAVVELKLKASFWNRRRSLESRASSLIFVFPVKFDNLDALPPILNALETDNGGNRLVLEVAV
jgi:F-type H+-transporting ATPase subunit beta